MQEDFEVTPAILDELQVYLSAIATSSPASAIGPSHRDWIQSRLKQELMTLAFGVAKGDEIEMQRDPVVQRALAIIGAKR